ncbi:MAG: ATP--guanido phosphotransferase [Clostridiales bacterium]|nr:ATP--guanido phosphotransferase [Clostridiales bacterium]
MIDFTLGTQVSTRIRLARNLEGYPFPSHLKDERKAKEIIRQVSAALNRLDEFSLYYMDDISPSLAGLLKENHLISPALIKNQRISAALINGEESVSIMINEEDHLREQCIVKGFDLSLAYETMSEIDSKIASSIKFVYDEQFGYLTACPTNIGTGLRASVMLFLPAITINGEMDKVINSVSRLGLTVRGLYGEGSEAEGYMYQISNEVTLGVTEEEILSEVQSVTEKLTELEASERYKLLNGENALDIKDKCLRSYGILTNCAKISIEELVKLCANIKLGACLGYLNISEVSAIDDLVIKMRPTNIDRATGSALTQVEMDKYRAEYAGKKLKSLIIL